MPVIQVAGGLHSGTCFFTVYVACNAVANRAKICREQELACLYMTKDACPAALYRESAVGLVTLAISGIELYHRGGGLVEDEDANMIRRSKESICLLGQCHTSTSHPCV